MAIIQTQTTLTTAQQVKSQIDGSVNALLNQMKIVYLQNFGRVWKPTNYTTAELLGQYGSDATQLFILSALLRDTILEADPDSLPAETLTPLLPVTFHTNGTVTINP